MFDLSVQSYTHSASTMRLLGTHFCDIIYSEHT